MNPTLVFVAGMVLLALAFVGGAAWSDNSKRQCMERCAAGRTVSDCQEICR